MLRLDHVTMHVPPHQSGILGVGPRHWCTRPGLLGPGPSKPYAKPSLEVIRWVPPPTGFVKVNTDASVRNDGRGGYGGLIRDERGVWVLGFCGYLGDEFESGITSVVRAELTGILAGLQTARAMGLRFVIIESDCKVAVDKIIDGADIENDKHSLIIREIRALLSMGGCYYTIRHQKREGNFCADKMAKFGVEGEAAKVIFTRPPAQIVPLLIADNAGVGYLRGTRL